MPTLSPLQILPSHVVKLIVTHMIDSNRHAYDGIKACPEECHSRIEPMLWVCHIFREEALSRISIVSMICLCDYMYEPGLIDSIQRCPWINCMSYVGQPTWHLAKVLNIVADLECIYSGRALEMLSRSPYHRYALPLVRELDIKFDPSVRHRGPELAQSAVEANITAFVQKLWQIAPRIRTFNSRSLDLVNWPKRYATDFGILAKQLAQRTSRVQFILKDRTWPLNLNFDGISDLTHIEFASDSSLMQFIQLAQRSARSLQSLQIVPHKVAPLYYPDISGLIWDGKSRFTAYPSLQKLVLDLPVNLDRRAVVPPQPVFGTFAPFPALRSLTVAEFYPFGDDTLFRGNSKTLEYMHMIALPNVVLMLRERQVFMPDSHPRLQRVLIQGANGSLPEYFGGSSGNFLEFVLSIAPDAATRVIIGVRFDKEISRVLDLFSLHPSIQILSLNGTNFTLLTVIRLVKALPLLSDLYLDYPTLDRSISVFSWADIITSSVRKYAPMGKWFKFWCFSTGGKLTREMVQCVMLLAVLCPNFNYVMSSGDNQMEFMLLARKVIASPGFKDFEQRLRRVLPDVHKPATFAEDRCPLMHSTMSSLRRKYGA
ncbi:hypothetical protein H4R27_000700 [Coemansia aciculifera]|nr:hypothetical protein H4R27_000700 [Coemansia aciculifera]